MKYINTYRMLRIWYTRRFIVSDTYHEVRVRIAKATTKTKNQDGFAAGMQQDLYWQP
jgi:hypothetical protein